MVPGRDGLLSRAQRGNRLALELPRRQEWVTIYRIVARWVASRQEAEDLTVRYSLSRRHRDGYQSASDSFVRT
jgi:hypothetical protein